MNTICSVKTCFFRAFSSLQFSQPSIQKKKKKVLNFLQFSRRNIISSYYVLMHKINQSTNVVHNNSVIYSKTLRLKYGN